MRASIERDRSPGSMRRSKVTWGLLAAFAVTSPAGAYAETMISNGEIASIDPPRRQFSLADGRVFAASPKVKLSKRTVGEKVIIVYEVKDGAMQATKVRRMPGFLESAFPLPERKPLQGTTQMPNNGGNAQ